MATTDMDQKQFSIVVAATLKGGIGLNGGLPWRIPQDMKMFAAITTSVSNNEKVNAVIMGRKTYESLPDAYRPLPKRLNIVISTTLPPSSLGTDDPAAFSLDCTKPLVAPSLAQALQLCWSHPLSERLDKTFVIGGTQVFTEALHLPQLARVFLTRVVGEPTECDTFVPDLVSLDDCFDAVTVSRTYTHKQLSFDYVEYRRRSDVAVKDVASESSSALPTLADFFCLLDKKAAARDDVQCCPSVALRLHEEFQYLDLIADILRTGLYQDDRTGVGTYFKIGASMRFDLQHSFPLLTTKAVFWRGVVEELLWFLRGDTNANHLSEKGVKIWDANAGRGFLDSAGFTEREEGDLGPVYGFQWRHFGATYVDMHTNYAGQGVDQLQNCITALKTNPNSRRIIMSAWNPAAEKHMVLPPCHMFSQFFVSDGDRLSCLMYQRSADMGLGVPFNIASYSLLCCMLAKVCGLRRGEFVHVMGNAHVYTNHVDPLKEQLQRVPRPFPILTIDDTVKDIESFEPSHFHLSGYSPHPRIPMKMAV